MRKIITSILLLLAVTAIADERYTLSVMGEYGYNRTQGSIGEVGVVATMPVVKNVELGARVELSSVNMYTMAATVMPKFALPVGELYTDVDLYYRAVAYAKQWDFVTALSLGYRMDYVDVEVGFFSRIMDVYHRNPKSEQAYNAEPFNLLYRLRVNTRPSTENWNLWFALSNKDDFQYERMWQPLFMIGARYDIRDHWRILLDAQLKLAGMFHLNAEFYAANARVGFAYIF